MEDCRLISRGGATGGDRFPLQSCHKATRERPGADLFSSRRCASLCFKSPLVTSGIERDEQNVCAASGAVDISRLVVKTAERGRKRRRRCTRRSGIQAKPIITV